MQQVPFNFTMPLIEKYENGRYQKIADILVIGNAKVGNDFYPDIVSLNVLKAQGYSGNILPSMLPTNSELFAAIENHCDYLKENMPTASYQVISEEMDKGVNDVFQYLGDIFNPSKLAK